MKTILKRISAGMLAVVFLATFAMPRTKAIVAEGFDIVEAANAVIATHLTALGGELSIAEGGASALTASTESLFMQAGAAGAFGAGVTGAAAMSTLVTGLNAFAGGFMLGYEGYQVVTQFVEWLKANKLISADEANTIFQTGGEYNELLDGRILDNLGNVYYYGLTYATKRGTSFQIVLKSAGQNSDGKKLYKYSFVGTGFNGQIYTYETSGHASYINHDCYYFAEPPNVTGIVVTYGAYSSKGVGIPESGDPDWGKRNWMENIFGPAPSTESEKREITYTSPATWTPPAPKPGQSVLYKPFPDAPDKGLEDIIADVPESIASSNFKPATTTVIDTPTPEPPPTPDVPPTVNPNPDVEAPEDVTPYTVKIGEVFPFCIPFDLYHMVTMFSAEPEAPHAEWTFSLPWSPQQEYKVEWDLKKFDDLAELCRKLELILFCVGLAVVTSKLIKW